MIPIFFIFLFDSLFLCMIFAWLPTMQGASALFGVHVSRDYYLGDGMKLVWRFRGWLAMLTIIAVGILTLYFWTQDLERPPNGWDVAYWGLTLLAWMIVASALFFHYARIAETNRVVDRSTKVVASMKIRTLRQYTSLAFEGIVACIILLPITLLVLSYPELPEKIPAHYDLYGVPDRWTSRSIVNVFMLPLISIWMHGLLWIVRVGVLRTKMPLPVEHTEEYRQGKEHVIELMMAMMDWLRLVLAILLGAIACNLPAQTIDSWHLIRPYFGPTMLVSGILVFVVVFSYLIRLSITYNELDKSVGQVRVMTKGEEEGWIWGGAIYYNPSDPAVFVEKKIGIGFTLNFAQRWAWFPIVYMLLGLIGILVFVVTLSDR